MKQITPAEKCKQYGLKNLKELSDATKRSAQTLSNWSKNKPELFDTLIKGVVFDKYSKYFDKKS